MRYIVQQIYTEDLVTLGIVYKLRGDENFRFARILRDIQRLKLETEKSIIEFRIKIRKHAEEYIKHF